MKVLVFFTIVVAFCYSINVNSDRHVTVGEDGTVTIIGQQGQQSLLIYRNLNNPEKLDIVLKSPMGVIRKIEVDEVTNNINDVDVNMVDNNKLNTLYYNNQFSQPDILADIFRQYEGKIEESTYQAILDHIQSLVKYGLIHESVYDVLKNLEHIYMIEELKRQQIYPNQNKNQDTYMHPVRNVMPVSGYLENPSLHYSNDEYMTPNQDIEMRLQEIRSQIYQLLEKEKDLEQYLIQNQNQKQMIPVYNQYYQSVPLSGLLNGNYYKQNAQAPQIQMHGLQKVIQIQKWDIDVPQQGNQNQWNNDFLGSRQREEQLVPQEMDSIWNEY